MSNLSELLPTGGGQNVVDFVATGTLGNGQSVALKTDGTVEAITGFSGSQTVYAAVDYGGGAPNNTKGYGVAYSTNADKFVFLYTNNLYYVYAQVATVSGNGFTLATPVVLLSATSYAACIHYNPVNFTFFIAYADAAYQGPGYARGASLSGTTLSLGSTVTWSTSNTSPEWMNSVYDSSTNRHILCYGVSDPYPLQPYVAAFSGAQSISLQIAKTATFGSTAANKYVHLSYDTAQNAVLLFGSNSSFYQVYMGMTTGGSSFTFGTVVTSTSATVSAGTAMSGYDKTTNKHLVGFRSNSGTNYLSYVLVTLSGTAVTVGNPVNGPYVSSPATTLNSITIWYDEVAKTITSAAFAYNTAAPQILPIDTSGATAVMGAVVTGDISQHSKGIYAASGLIANASYRSALTTMASSGAPRASLYSNAYLVTTNTALIGITAEAISSGATGPVNVLGGINTSQSGLTVTSDYYVQSDGTITTASASPAVKVGQAVSSTTINLMDLT
tara:strand:- start:1443 stop:2942 length:1500 start_codon:yes stop_codon:yes gene_type:complete